MKLFAQFQYLYIFSAQFQAILSDETAIEQLQKKGPHRPRKPKMALLSEVFGRGNVCQYVLFMLQKSKLNEIETVIKKKIIKMETFNSKYGL